MGALGTKLRSMEGGHIAFWCPGCNQAHTIRLRTDTTDGWGYCGNVESPTFTPSVLCRSGHYAPINAGKDCWCTFEERNGNKPAFTCYQCHLFVTKGKILFLTDCSHALAGQTVDLPDFPDDWGTSP